MVYVKLSSLQYDTDSVYQGYVITWAVSGFLEVTWGAVRQRGIYVDALTRS